MTSIFGSCMDINYPLIWLTNTYNSLVVLKFVMYEKIPPYLLAMALPTI